METEKKLYAIAAESCREYLTAGKEYEIQSIQKSKVRKFKRAFEIINDNREISYCLERECAHLRFGDWKIVER